MAMGEDFTAQKKMLPVVPIFVLYLPMAMLRNVGSSVRSEWDLLMKGSGFVGTEFPESN
jgi:hypothetical protein